MLQLHRRGADAAARRCRCLGSRVFGQLARAGDVVGVGMRLQRPHQGQALGLQQGQIAFQLGVYRVDDDGVGPVLVDELVSLGLQEPFRLFRSRAEYWLSLRVEKGVMRLTEIGR